MKCAYCGKRIETQPWGSFAKIDDIGWVVRIKRKYLNLSQQQLADKVGIGRSYVAKIEKNEYIPSLLKIVQLADIIFPNRWGKIRFANACLRKKTKISPKMNFTISLDPQVFKE